MTTSAPDSAPVDRSTVLAWMAEHGRGYKAAAAEFGIPRSTIQGWAHAERDAGKPRPQAPKPRAPARKPEPPPEAEEEPWDPTTCDRETWLRRGMVRAMQRSAEEQAKGHGGTAARWEAVAGKYRDGLDEELARKAAAGLVPAPVDLTAMAREHAELLPSFIRIDPDRFEPSARLLVAELAKYKGGVWAECAELLKGGL